MPEAKAKPALPRSIAARLASSAARVGFCVRAYSYPLCSPELLLHVRRGLEDRRDDGAGARIGLLAGVDADRGEVRASGELHSGNVIIRANSSTCCAPRLPLHRDQSRRHAAASFPRQRACGADPPPSPVDLLFETRWSGPPVPRRGRAEARRRRLAARRRACPGVIEVLSSAATIGLIVSVGYFVWRLFLLMQAAAAVARAPQADPVLHLHRRRAGAADHRVLHLFGGFVLSMNVSAYLFTDGYDDVVRLRRAGGQRRGERRSGGIRRPPRDGGARAAERQQPPAGSTARLSIVFVPHRRCGAAAACAAGEWSHAAGAGPHSRRG